MSDEERGARRGAPAAGPAPEVGRVLRTRAGEVGKRLVAAWQDGSIDTASGLDATEAAVVESAIADAALAGTFAVADFLVTGESAAPRCSEQWIWSGEKPLSGLVTLSGLAKLYLRWRLRTTELVHEVAVELGAPEEVVRRCTEVVTSGSDAGLVGMAKRFEVTRHAREEKLAEDQARLEHQALHDPLTGLANRALLLDRLDHAIQATERRAGGLSVLFMDLDFFKSVNDTSGHSAGDQLLLDVASRLRTVVRPTDTLARLGGDEFVVVCEDLADPVAEGVAIADRIAESLERPFRVADHDMVIAACIGVAAAGPDKNAEALLARADQAMYHAKQRGRRRVEVYDPAIDRQESRRARLASELHEAVKEGGFHLAYQPVLALPGRTTTVREALLRWRHPEMGDVSPAELVPVAERTGLIVEIGSWVLRRACHDCARWRATDDADVGVSVNISALQLESERFRDEVEAALDASGLPPGALTLEVSEAVLMVDRVESRAGLERLRSLGVRIAIDDFGTGYSSLDWLAHLPLHTLKIDRNFISSPNAVERDSVVVEAIVGLAHTLGLAAVAEGVETEAQLSRLAHLGCDGAQGYLLGPPRSLDPPLEPSGGRTA